jgi:hypothetical protein
MATTTIAVTTKITLPEDKASWQVQDLEMRILEKSREAARQAYREALELYEKHLIKQHTEWDRKERPVKKLATRLGDFRYQRYRVWDRNEKRSRYPLDEALGMRQKERASPAYQKAVVDQAVKRSYRQSTHEMTVQTGGKRSVMSDWRIVQQAAVKEQAQQRKEDTVLDWKHSLLPDPPQSGEPDPCPVLGIDVDDTYCRSWKTKKRLKDHIVRVAALYRHKERVSKHRWKLKDKTVVVSGPGETLAHFLNRVVQTAVTHYGLHDNTLAVVHGDGDPQIRNFALTHFTRSLYRLDPWHVKKKIQETFGWKKIPDDWYSDIYGRPDELIAKIKQAASVIQRRDPRKEKCTALIGYLANNRDGMLPSGISKITKQKYPRLFKRGSGTVERNVDWTVGARFKQSRMSWSEKGLDNLLCLRENALNQEVQPTYPPQPGKPLDLACLN